MTLASAADAELVLSGAHDNAAPLLYTVLGCATTSSAEQVRAEYRVRAKRSHPDKRHGGADRADDDRDGGGGDDGGGGEALTALRPPRTFAALAAAYAVLSDAEQRALYDRFLSLGVHMSWRQFTAMQDKCTFHWSGAAPSVADTRGIAAASSDNRSTPDAASPAPLSDAERRHAALFANASGTPPPTLEQRGTHIAAFRTGSGGGGKH